MSFLFLVIARVAINECSNRECCHGNKIFYVLEFLSSFFIGVPSLVDSDQ